MGNPDRDTLEGVLWDEHAVVSVQEICTGCGVQTETVQEMVAYGIIEPLDDDPRRWHFAGTSLRRVRTAVRLQRDLGVNLAGVALALELIDELAQYRRQAS